MTVAVKGEVSFEWIDHGYKKILKEIKKLDNSFTAVGWFGHGGTPADDVAARAAVNEYGASIRVTKKMRGYLAGALGINLKKKTRFIKIPSRPFVRKTASLFKRRAIKRIEIEYGNMLLGRITAKHALSRLGEWYAGRTKWVMTHVRFTPNHPATIRKKGSSRPLIGSGEMMNRIDHKEVMK